MPTSPKVKKAMLQLLESELPKKFNGNIAELGSGFLTLAIALHGLFPKCKITAYETSHVPYFLSKVYALLFLKEDVKIRRENFLKADLSSSKLIVCYLYPGAMQALKTKFEQELTPGTWIISNTFAIPGWTPVKTMIVDDLYNTKVYLYKKK